MILQNLRVPEPEYCPDPRVYYTRRPEDISCFKKGEILDLTSYYNFFSISKWTEYTEIKNYYLHIDIKGRFILEIISNITDTVDQMIIENSGDIKIQNMDCSILSIRLTSMTDGSSFLKGYFYTPEKIKNNIKLALNVCTYKREKYVDKKIDDLISSYSLFKEPYSNSVEMFIVDNAGTYMCITKDPRIHIFKNRNYGGSGGYARGIYEIRKTGMFTHAVYMDDDTVLDFEAVYRLFTLLSYIKDEWKGSLVGGAMMKNESPSVIYETSATMTESDEILNDYEIDVSDTKSLLKLNEEKNSNYNGWWFCCTPHIKESDYPAPMFVAYDDVEYGARYGHKVITLNGISVWHDSFDSKYSVSRFYYDYRNMMIARAMTDTLTPKILFKVLYHSALETLYTRYENSDIFLRGLEDFFKGPEFIESLNPESFNSELSKIGLLKPISELPIEFNQKKFDQSMSMIDKKRDYFRSIITLNGILLPSKGETIAPLKVKKMSVFYRANRILHCNKTGQYGFITELDRKRALKRLFSIPFIFIRYSFKLNKISKKYSKKAQYLHSEEFWMKYLGLR